MSTILITMIENNLIQILKKREYFMIVTQNGLLFKIGSCALLLKSYSQSADTEVEDMKHTVNTTIDCSHIHL